MAFKPFDLFRKRSKMMMAILVLVAMFSFIFIGIVPNVGGEGTAVGGWFRRIFGQEEKVFSVDGQGYSAPKADEMLINRMDCYRFLGNYLQEGETRVQQKFSAGGDSRDTANPELNEKQSEMRQAVCARVFQQHFQNIQIQMMMSRDMSVFTTDALEFAYYLKKADELGIVMPRNKVMDDLRKAGGDTIKEGDLPGLMQGWKIKRSVDSVIEALGNEIRAVMARAVIEAPGGFMAPALSAQPTARDLWENWVYLKTGAAVTMLDFPAEAYVGEVKAPSADVLQKYFDKYKHQLPDPAKATPGFKTPKLFQLEFVFADVSRGKDGGARAYYDRKAEEIRMLRLLASPVPIKVDEKTVAFGPMTLKVPVWIGFELLGRYEGERSIFDRIPKKSKYKLDESALSLFIGGTKLSDGTIYDLPWTADGMKDLTGPKLEAMNAAAALMAASPSIGGELMTPGLTLTVTPYAHRVLRAQPYAFPILGGPALGGPFPAWPELGYAEFKIKEISDDIAGRYKPLAEVYMEMLKDDNDDLVRELLNADFVKLEQNLRTYALEYNAWLQRKKNKSAKVPASPEPPLIRDQSTEEKPFDIFLEHGPEVLAKTQGLKEGVPFDQYIQKWAADRNIEFVSKEKFGEPRTKADFLKAETLNTPVTTLLKPLFIELDEKGRKLMPAPPIDTEGGELDKLMIESLIGDWMFRGREPTEPMGKQPLKPMEPRAVMSLTLRKEQGDQVAMYNSFLKSNQAALHWKAVEIEEKTPAFTDPGVAEMVEKAWKLEHAREEAKKAADEFVKKYKNADPSVGLFPDIEERKKEHPARVETMDLSRFDYKDSRSPTGGGFGYSARKVPSWVQQPPPRMIEEILTQLHKPGDAVVIENNNKNHYYVVVLRSRTEPSLKSFDRDLIQSPEGDKPTVDGRGYSNWVLQRKSEEYQKEWNAYLWKKLGFDPESPLGKHFQDSVKDTLR